LQYVRFQAFDGRVFEAFDFLGCYVEYVGKYLRRFGTAYGSHLKRVRQSKKMELIGCPETLNNYLHTESNMPEELGPICGSYGQTVVAVFSEVEVHLLSFISI
jgi:hypothetical protein